MRYTRSGIGLLNAQYRSVLKKCFLINLGLFALGVGVAAAEDYIIVDNYQDFQQTLCTFPSANVIFNGAGNGIDLSGGEGISINNGQTVNFENIGTNGISSWTNTSYNIKNKGTISLDNIIFSKHKTLNMPSGLSAGGGITLNNGYITKIENSIFDNNYAEGASPWGGAIYNGGSSIGNITGDFTSNYAKPCKGVFADSPKIYKKSLHLQAFCVY